MWWILGVAFLALVGDSDPTPHPLDGRLHRQSDPTPTDPTGLTDLTGVHDLSDLTDEDVRVLVEREQWSAFTAAHLDVLSPARDSDLAPDAGDLNETVEYARWLCAQEIARRTRDQARPPQRARRRWQQLTRWASRHLKNALAWWRRHGRQVLDLVVEALIGRRTSPGADSTAEALSIFQSALRLT